jgi:hypothetical protein
MIELITVVLKIFLTFAKAYLAFNQEEKERFEERMKTLSGILKDSISDQSESINENDYLSNMAWEKQERYKKYKKATFDILVQGGGIFQLLEVEGTLGMKDRVQSKKDKVVEILTKNLNIEEKSKAIAALLIEE